MFQQIGIHPVRFRDFSWFKDSTRCSLDDNWMTSDEVSRKGGKTKEQEKGKRQKVLKEVNVRFRVR